MQGPAGGVQVQMCNGRKAFVNLHLPGGGRERGHHLPTGVKRRRELRDEAVPASRGVNLPHDRKVSPSTAPPDAAGLWSVDTQNDAKLACAEGGSGRAARRPADL